MGQNHVGKEMSEAIWYNRDDFVRQIERSVPTAGLWNKDDIFSLCGIDTQLSSFDDKGVILLRTCTVATNNDLEEFAVRKVGGVWKFSLRSEEIEKVKY